MNEQIRFLYSFDMKKDVPHFEIHEETVQIDAERYVTEVIYESFVITADQDYLMARILALKGLERGFFWAAAQSIEKYLKAFLLIRGEGVRNYRGHPLKQLYSHAIQIEDQLRNLVIAPHPKIRINSEWKALCKTYTVHEFLDVLEDGGGPDSRYNMVGTRYETGYLFALDSLVHHFRGQIGVPEIKHSFYGIEQDLFPPFYHGNFWLSPENEPLELPCEVFPMRSSRSVTKLEIVLKHKAHPPFSLAHQWLEKKMKL